MQPYRMRINKDTELCISISSNPGNFGTTLYNDAFRALDLNFLYKAFSTNDLKGAFSGIRALNIRGCSISMPFKHQALEFLDFVDADASVTSSVNSVVNQNGQLMGYNTDVAGARNAFKNNLISLDGLVLMLGSGAMARSVALSLKQMGVKKIKVSCRNEININALESILACELVPWSDKWSVQPDLLINATPLGMNSYDDDFELNDSDFEKIKTVVDVVVFPMETRLIKRSRELEKKVIPGHLIALEQFIEQFKLYTGIYPPRKILEASLLRLTNS